MSSAITKGKEEKEVNLEYSLRFEKAILELATFSYLIIQFTIKTDHLHQGLFYFILVTDGEIDNSRGYKSSPVAFTFMNHTLSEWMTLDKKVCVAGQKYFLEK